MVSSPYYYKLYNHVTMTSGSSCVTFGRYSSGATLDCQGNKISTSISGITSGIYMGSGVSNINVVNCPVEGFKYGVRIDGASNIRFDRLDLLNNEYGYYITNPDNLFITRNWITHYTTGNVGINASYAAGGANRNLTIYDNYIDHFNRAVEVTGISRVNITRAEVMDSTNNVNVLLSSQVNISGMKMYRATKPIYLEGVSGATVTDSSLGRAGPASNCDIDARSIVNLNVSNNTIPNFYLCLNNVAVANFSYNYANSTTTGYLWFTNVNDTLVPFSNNEGRYVLYCSYCNRLNFSFINASSRTYASSITDRITLDNSNNITLHYPTVSSGRVGTFLLYSSNIDVNNLTSRNNTFGFYSYRGGPNFMRTSNVSDGASFGTNTTLTSSDFGSLFIVFPAHDYWGIAGCSVNMSPVNVSLVNSTVRSTAWLTGFVRLSLNSSTIPLVQNYSVVRWIAGYSYGYGCQDRHYFNTQAPTIIGTGVSSVTANNNSVAGWCYTYQPYTDTCRAYGPYWGTTARDLIVTPSPP
jgi:hypothetical protein